jgi:hydroxymethylglutaryl-CoA reductase
VDNSSRLPGFYKLSIPERQQIIAEKRDLSDEEIKALAEGGMTVELADRMVENLVGIYGMPMGIAANFLINNQDYLIPMVIEEPSVVAACSHAAKLVRDSGGFFASADDPILVGQIQVLMDETRNGDSPDVLLTIDHLSRARDRILGAKAELLDLANSANPNLVRRGGGAREIEVRDFFDPRTGPMLVVHLAFDTRDAMGANLVNTACEMIAGRVAELAGGRVNLRILTNLSDRRIARANCRVTKDVVGGEEVVKNIVQAQALAEIDRYRAATHNKGVMNGIDALALATGNDWRALEAGAHAYAARDGFYRSLTKWDVASNGDLVGSIELPIAVGIVGGMTKAHPAAQVALKILGVHSSVELAAVMSAVGLAQNLAALKALATEGIQRGHMELHSRRLAREDEGSGNGLTPKARTE